MLKKSIIALTASLLIGACHPDRARAFDFSTSRGMNLIDLSGPGWYPPGKFRDADFQILADRKFNIVRLPLDYRLFTIDGKPAEIDEAKFLDIDHGLKLAKDHKIHANLCFFAVPGYAVYAKDQTPSLWQDQKLQDIFVSYWRYFAERYKKVPPAELSFNLINEPPWGLPEEIYANLMRKAIHAIREIDPKRQIIVDGLESGRLPVMSLADEPNTLQSAHFYEPFELTHHKADWLSDSAEFPPATVWPLPMIPHHLFGVKQAGLSPLVIDGDFSAFSSMEIDLKEVLLSPETPMQLSLVGENGKPIFQNVEPLASWKVIREKDGDRPTEYKAGSTLSIKLPPHSQRISLAVEKGDRLTFSAIRLVSPDGRKSRDLTPTNRSWIKQPGPIKLTSSGEFQATVYYDGKWIRDHLQETWKPLMDLKVPIVVHEFGCNFLLPHQASVSYIADCRKAFEELGFGWCYFSNTGTLGIMDSKRTDVPVTRLPDGRPMDSQMMDILSSPR